MMFVWKHESKAWWLYRGDEVIMKLLPDDDRWVPYRHVTSPHATPAEMDVFWRWAMTNVVNSDELEIEMGADLVEGLRGVARIVKGYPEQEGQGDG